MTPEILNQAVRHCRLIIGEEATTTDVKIDQAIAMVKTLLGTENIDAIRLKQELQTIYSTQIETLLKDTFALIFNLAPEATYNFTFFKLDDEEILKLALGFM